MNNGTWRAILCHLIILFISLPEVSAGSTDGEDIIRLLTPQEGLEAIAKKPLIKCSSSEPLRRENLLVIFDYIDITDVLDITPEGFVYTPVEVVAPGPHTLSVTARLRDGREFKKEFAFSTRHTQEYEAAYSNNELSTLYEAAVIKPDDTTTVAGSRLDSNLRSETALRKKEWEVSFNTNLRLLEQDIPIEFPLKKGLNLSDYLLRLRYTRDKFQALSEIGDIQIDETPNTVMDLARRGGKITVQDKSVELNAFVVNSAQVFNFRDGTGLEGTTDDHIMGASAGGRLFSDKLYVRTVYVTGTEDRSVFGISAPGETQEGDVLGLLVGAGLIENKLAADAEYDVSKFDRDVSDEFPPERDKAYRLRAGGLSGSYSYEALYEYKGPNYDVPGNWWIQKDLEGFLLRTGANLQPHSLNLLFSRHNDNVEESPLQPRIYTSQGTADYSFNKFPSLPIGASFQKTVVDSARETSFFSPIRMDTDVVSGRVNYIKGKWNFGVRASQTLQDDRVRAEDIKTTSYGFTSAYISEHFSVVPGLTLNRSGFESNGQRTDTRVANVVLWGDVLNRRVTYNVAGTYISIEPGGGNNIDILTANFRLGYLLSRKLQKSLNPVAGIRTLYRKTDVGTAQNDEFVLLMFLSTGVPFSF